MINATNRRCNTVFVYLLCKTDPTGGRETLLLSAKRVSHHAVPDARLMRTQIETKSQLDSHLTHYRFKTSHIGRTSNIIIMSITRNIIRTAVLLLVSLPNSNIWMVTAQGPPGGGGGPPGGGGGGGGMTCSTTVQYTGTPSTTPRAAPLRGNVGCVDLAVLTDRADGVTTTPLSANIYGPMEAGFTSTVPGMSCLGTNTIAGGIDTNLAEHMVEYFCPGMDIQVLDSCGGHAVPYQYVG
jgi:hypothetical protein